MWSGSMFIYMYSYGEGATEIYCKLSIQVGISHLLTEETDIHILLKALDYLTVIFHLCNSNWRPNRLSSFPHNMWKEHLLQRNSFQLPKGLVALQLPNTKNCPHQALTAQNGQHTVKSHWVNPHKAYILHLVYRRKTFGSYNQSNLYVWVII